MHHAAEMLCDGPDAQDLRAGHVHHPGWGRDLLERPQYHGIRVPLPDGVEVAHPQVDWLPGPDVARQVHEHAVPQVASVVQADQGGWRIVSPAEVLEHT